MNQKLYVFSSSRTLYGFLQSQEEGFLPQALTLGEFFSEVVIVEGKKKAPPMLRKFLLLQTLKEFECNDKEAQILFFEKNFLGYLESSSFLLDFFNELHQNCVQIQDIPLKDIYGDYEDHLQILQKIYEGYQNKLSALGYYDYLDEFKIFDTYLQKFQEIEIYIDGFISTIEQKILQEIAKNNALILNLDVDRFNIRHYDFLGVKLQEDTKYKIGYPSLQILQSTPNPLQSQIHSISCDLRVGECAFILQKVNEWLSEGIDPNKIAIVLPQEDLIRLLRICDEGKNLNFAMGFEAKELQKVLEELKNPLLDYQPTQSKVANLITQTHQLLENFPTELGRKIDEILFEYQCVEEILEGFDYQDLVWIFQKEIEKLRVSNIKGGKVKVMGMLETRGESFEKVIIADFSPENIPQVSHQDMFLNTKIRNALQMPTLRDKQELQKHYYFELFKNTQEVYVLCIQQGIAPLIKEIGAFGGFEIGSYTLFDKPISKEYKNEDIASRITEDFVCSASSLSIFKECKRKFYYQYILRLKEIQQEEESIPKEIGTLTHQLLEKSYKECRNAKEAREIFFSQLQKEIDNTQGERKKIQLELLKREMGRFWEREQSDFPDSILGLEVEFKDQNWGLGFSGKIDRIDKKGECIRVIDYKYSNHFSSSCNPLQSALYWGWVSKQYPHNEVKMYFYDLKKGELVESKKLQEEIIKLEELVQELKAEREFAMSVKYSPCRGCVYRILCQR